MADNKEKLINELRECKKSIQKSRFEFSSGVQKNTSLRKNSRKGIARCATKLRELAKRSKLEDNIK